jgi:hypothetical protein
MKEEPTRIGESYDTGAPDPGPVKDSLDDTSPINPAADLELVTRGNAYWTENRPEAAKPADDEEKTEVSPTATDKAKAKDSKPSKAQAAIFEREAPSGHAPTLAELASKRREEMGSASRSTSESARSKPGSKAGSRSSEKDPDDTDPEGLQTPKDKISGAASFPEQSVSVVSRSLDVAFIDGHSLFIPGATWTSGENLVVQGKTYQLKRKSTKYPISPQLAGYIGGGFAAGCLLTWMLLSGSAAPSGNIFGLVREAGTGRLLSGVTVAIEDAGKTSQSDPTGMFSFEELREGIYTLVATDPIYGKQRRTVTVSHGTASIMLDLEREAVAVVEPPKREPVKPKPQPVVNETQNSEATANSKGELAVTASVANAKIYIDGKMLGVGNAVYTGIRAGERVVRVEHEGFAPWTKSVNIKGGQTNRIEPELLAAEPLQPELLSPEQYAAAGRKQLEARQYAAAAEQFTLAIKGAQRGQFFAWRADAYVGMKKLQAAEGDFLAALALFKQTGEANKLDAMLERAVLVVPASAPLRMAYGDYLYAERKLGDAIRSYQKALELGADDTKAQIAIGLAQYAGGSFEEANTSWTLADEASGGIDPHVAGYLALSNARLQYRASCRNAVRRLLDYPDVLRQFRSHPDWDKVRHLTGEG